MQFMITPIYTHLYESHSLYHNLSEVEFFIFLILFLTIFHFSCLADQNIML